MNFTSRVLRQEMLRRGLKIIEAHCQKGVFLDYGCGSGNMLKAALARGWNRAGGIEIGENARSVLKNQNLEVYADLKSAEALRARSTPLP
jgi:16S rRNA G966 N2-methylase RsmD